MAAGTREACIRNAYIDSTCAVSTWIRCTSDGGTYTSGICAKSDFVRDVEPGVGPKILLRLGPILAGPGVNDYCLILSISLIFASINSASHCFIGN